MAIFFCQFLDSPFEVLRSRFVAFFILGWPTCSVPRSQRRQVAEYPAIVPVLVRGHVLVRLEFSELSVWSTETEGWVACCRMLLNI